MEKLVWQEARAHQIKISDQEIASYIELLAKGQGLTSKQFQAQRAQESYPEELFQDQVKVEIAKQKLIGKLFQNSLDVDESEIEKYIKNNPQLNQSGNKIKLKILFLSKKKHTAGEIVSLSKKIQNKLSEGHDFSALAQQYSDDPSANNGGDIGMVSEADLSSDFSDALLEIKDNGHTKSIESVQGIHILKVEKRFSSENKDSDNLRAFAKNKIKEGKLQKKIAEYFTNCLLYTSPSPRDKRQSRMPSSA